MKKNNKFEGLWEDEESLKMMEIINESANKEYANRKQKMKKAKKQDLIIKIFVIASLLFILGCILYISNKMFEKNVTECVAKGEDRAICEYKFSK